ncbi:Cu-processing system ATP-binding protein [Cyclobacterium lianum]|uniref:Cu-processing system ATP-binding protein n=1 Tax=Cyclobacterium lianum TaxID=388280 RepID=A0A1M7KFB8_9BACT|nr:ABC transporter ATP-binding protein [Cyclobacterium lianum]SHM63968.1 Cu-processing system ATP-binding protein [Cyclobacterium lianum]
MIKIDHLYKNFGRHQVLNDISLHFEKNQAIALIGPNGSGKSTLIKTILGLVLPQQGEITFDGISIAGQSHYRKEIGYMPQMSRFPANMTVSQLFSMMKSLRKNETRRDLDLYRAFDIDQMGSKRLEILSGGMKQKVSAALAFLFDPKVLVLDEPTAGLDPIANEILKNKLQQSLAKERLILISSHILNDLDDITTHVSYLMEGEVKFFKPLEQLKTETAESRLNRIIAQVLKQQNSHD